MTAICLGTLQSLGPEPKSTRYRPPGGARRGASSGRGERRRTSERGGGARPSKMAPSALLRPLSRLLAPARLPSGSSARSKFYVREPPNDKPDWLKVGLTLGSSAFLWIYLIKQHNEDVLEYKRRNRLE